MDWKEFNDSVSPLFPLFMSLFELSLVSTAVAVARARTKTLFIVGDMGILRSR